MISAMPPFFPGWSILTYTSTTPDGRLGRLSAPRRAPPRPAATPLLVDMPLNCLPATTTVAALEAKACSGARQLPGGLGGMGRRGARQSGRTSKPLAAAGVPGFKCFLIHPGIDGFTMVDEDDLRTALPHLARTGLPLLVHAELAGPVDAATERTGRRRLEMLRNLSAIAARRS